MTRVGDQGAGIYGFAIDPLWQGRGIGRDVLRRVCRQLREEGIRRIGLEVAVDNDHAVGLYTSLGFTLVTTEDYYALPSPLKGFEGPPSSRPTSEGVPRTCAE